MIGAAVCENCYIIWYFQIFNMTIINNNLYYIIQSKVESVKGHEEGR